MLSLADGKAVRFQFFQCPRPTDDHNHQSNKEKHFYKIFKMLNIVVTYTCVSKIGEHILQKYFTQKKPYLFDNLIKLQTFAFIFNRKMLPLFKNLFYNHFISFI